MMENNAIIEVPTDQRTITRRYTDKAIDVIKQNQTNPFFLYVPHSMPTCRSMCPRTVMIRIRKMPTLARLNT